MTVPEPAFREPGADAALALIERVKPRAASAFPPPSWECGCKLPQAETILLHR